MLPQCLVHRGHLGSHVSMTVLRKPADLVKISRGIRMGDMTWNKGGGWYWVFHMRAEHAGPRPGSDRA